MGLKQGWKFCAACGILIVKIQETRVDPMKMLQYTFKTDTLFKMLFIKHCDLLQKLIAVLMGIPFESITDFHVQNGELSPAALMDKFCRLDINMRVNGQLVDLEVQVCNEGDYIERVMFYWAMDFSSAIPSGGRYADLPRTIVLSIMDFSLFDCAEYHSFFQPLEVNRHELMSDKMGFHFFELPKLPGEIDGSDMLSLWLALFNASTEEDLEKIKALEVPEMEQAIDAYYTITASEEFREIARMRERACHNEASALYAAREEGIAEGIERGIEKGITKGAFNNMLESIRNIMDGLNLPIDQAMNLLKVPETDRLKCKEMLQPQ